MYTAWLPLLKKLRKPIVVVWNKRKDQKPKHGCYHCRHWAGSVSPGKKTKSQFVLHPHKIFRHHAYKSTADWRLRSYRSRTLFDLAYYTRLTYTRDGPNFRKSDSWFDCSCGRWKAAERGRVFMPLWHGRQYGKRSRW